MEKFGKNGKCWRIRSNILEKRMFNSGFFNSMHCFEPLGHLYIFRLVPLYMSVSSIRVRVRRISVILLFNCTARAIKKAPPNILVFHSLKCGTTVKFISFEEWKYCLLYSIVFGDNDRCKEKKHFGSITFINLKT